MLLHNCTGILGEDVELYDDELEYTSLEHNAIALTDEELEKWKSEIDEELELI